MKWYGAVKLSKNKYGKEHWACNTSGLTSVHQTSSDHRSQGVPWWYWKWIRLHRILLRISLAYQRQGSVMSVLEEIKKTNSQVTANCACCLSTMTYICKQQNTLHGVKRNTNMWLNCLSLLHSWLLNNNCLFNNCHKIFKQHQKKSGR